MARSALASVCLRCSYNNGLWSSVIPMSLVFPLHEPTHSNSVIDLTFASRDTVEKSDLISLSEEQKELLPDHKLQRWGVRITALRPKVKEISRYKEQEAGWDFARN
ncbi:hypothetical protein TRICI_002428 [Trichomonascus ciferrii]|uniref:Uncharacterized protein n=1 Tax=Trichomonascus ciferrii TaxID=44093 RepID=A0A642V5Y3_9ASCO|nr:hypothetical protein TRICI_002428 [Trichomonascus ciferrii]